MPAAWWEAPEDAGEDRGGPTMTTFAEALGYEASYHLWLAVMGQPDGAWRREVWGEAPASVRVRQGERFIRSLAYSARARAAHARRARSVSL